MTVRVLAAVATLAGGFFWTIRWVADLVGISGGWSDAADLAGLALLALGLAGIAVGLVSESALWLRAIVAVACPLLVWSVYSVVRGNGDAVTLNGVLGVIAVLGALGPLRQARPTVTPVRRAHGSHVAR